LQFAIHFKKTGKKTEVNGTMLPARTAELIEQFEDSSGSVGPGPMLDVV
jgi:hypothetical protein